LELFRTKRAAVLTVAPSTEDNSMAKINPLFSG
jgi:hypothetical protein